MPSLCKEDGNFPYSIVIPEEVERKIRLLCALSPKTEWSGILFYEPKGTFETELVITCRDILLMDVGTATYTEIDWETSEIAQYMVSHLDLFDCKMGLIHSHNTMSTFFSGTDQTTLRTEGNDMNVFVSLIVNNDGEYTAGITKRVTSSIQRRTTDTIVDKHPFYEGITVFQDGREETSEESLEETSIYWYNLKIVKANVSEKEMETLTEDERIVTEKFVSLKKKAPKTSHPTMEGWFGRPSNTERFYWGDTLFDTQDEQYPEDGINWRMYPGIRRAFWWFITGSPWTQTRYTLPDIWQVFPTDAQFLDWISLNLEYILTNLDLFGLDKIMDDYNIEDVELTAAVINRFKLMVPNKGTAEHDMILQVLDYYML